MIATTSQMMQVVLDTVRQMTPEQKRELREALVANFCRCGQHHTVMGPAGAVCECGERKLLVCNRERELS
jgi:aerobic-type carbon monoxide dehydrogenase small subunit (CoxS/CutS family)